MWLSSRPRRAPSAHQYKQPSQWVFTVAMTIQISPKPLSCLFFEVPIRGGSYVTFADVFLQSPRPANGFLSNMPLFDQQRQQSLSSNLLMHTGKRDKQSLWITSRISYSETRVCARLATKHGQPMTQFTKSHTQYTDPRAHRLTIKGSLHPDTDPLALPSPDDRKPTSHTVQPTPSPPPAPIAIHLQHRASRRTRHTLTLCVSSNNSTHTHTHTHTIESNKQYCGTFNTMSRSLTQGQFELRC